MREEYVQELLSIILPEGVCLLVVILALSSQFFTPRVQIFISLLYLMLGYDNDKFVDELIIGMLCHIYPPEGTLVTAPNYPKYIAEGIQS